MCTERQINDGWENYFLKADALWRYKEGGPHAAYELAARHSNFYLNTDILTTRASCNATIASALASLASPIINQDTSVSTYHGKVPAPTIIATAVASALQMDLQIYSPQYNYFITASKHKYTIVVADDIYSATSTKRLKHALESTTGRHLRAVIVVANFSGLTHIDNIPIYSLYSRPIKSWPADACPLCAIGSNALPARRFWSNLMQS